MNEYSDDDGYDMHAASGGELGDDEGPLFLSSQEAFAASVNFDDPDISSLPRVLLMGPRRGGKTSVQVSKVKRKERKEAGSSKFEVRPPAQLDILIAAHIGRSDSLSLFAVSLYLSLSR
jgi:hypothetical protein